jgi:hypothetical protein
MKAARDKMVVFFLAGLVLLLLGWLDSVRYRTGITIYQPAGISVGHDESLISLTVYWSDIGDDPVRFIRRPADRTIVFQNFSYFHLKEEISIRGVTGMIRDDCTTISIPYWMPVLIYLMAWALVFVRATHREKRVLHQGG